MPADACPRPKGIKKVKTPPGGVLAKLLPYPYGYPALPGGDLLNMPFVTVLAEDGMTSGSFDLDADRIAVRKNPSTGTSLRHGSLDLGCHHGQQRMTEVSQVAGWTLLARFDDHRRPAIGTPQAIRAIEHQVVPEGDGPDRDARQRQPALPIPDADHLLILKADRNTARKPVYPARPPPANRSRPTVY